jgi:hypothetical protein
MKKTKTQKGIQASAVGFGLSIVAIISISYNLCFWMIFFFCAIVLWVAGIGYIYSERKDFREQHQKSVEISAWIIGITVFVFIIGTLYYITEAFHYLTMTGKDSMTYDELHVLYVATMNYGYIQLFVITMLACSRTFMVLELGNKKGRRLLMLAMVVMLITAVIAFNMNNTAYDDQDKENERAKTNNPKISPINKTQLDKTQFTKISNDNRMYSLLPVLYEILFIAAYVSVNSRIESGELKPRAKEE